MIHTPAELLAQPAEFQTMVKKIIISHAINELASAWVYDEPAIALAPTPYWKWHACRVAMEEYGHHLRFLKMGLALSIPEADMIPGGSKPMLTMLTDKLGSWTEFCVFKMIVDLAEILQCEDLLECSYEPLRKAAKATMPEERFHVTFGTRACEEIICTPEGRRDVQAHVDAILPKAPAFFGAPQSANNELYRKWGLKQRTNEAIRDDYLVRVRAGVTKLGLTV